MGLDVSVYVQLEYVMSDDAAKGPDGKYDWERIESLLHVFIHPTHRHLDVDLREGWYRGVELGRLGFRAGSYGGYGEWRRQLAALVGCSASAIWKGGTAPAFRELIHNADNEGVIGPKTCAKLAKDFADWQSRAEAFHWNAPISRDELSRSEQLEQSIIGVLQEQYADAAIEPESPRRTQSIARYQSWRAAFEAAASREGLVELH